MGHGFFSLLSLSRHVLHPECLQRSTTVSMGLTKQTLHRPCCEFSTCGSGAVCGSGAGTASWTSSSSTSLSLSEPTSSLPFTLLLRWAIALTKFNGVSSPDSNLAVRVWIFLSFSFGPLSLLMAICCSILSKLTSLISRILLICRTKIQKFGPRQFEMAIWHGRIHNDYWCGEEHCTQSSGQLQLCQARIAPC